MMGSGFSSGQTKWKVLVGDCVDVMSGMDECSVGSVVCDPPYGIAFMGKDFDKLGSSLEQQKWHCEWAKQAFRVLKPGGYLLAFGGTRSYHRLACAIEDAGFEIRDSMGVVQPMAWVFGTGFPKGQNVSLALDKVAGVDRIQGNVSVTEEAKKWEGWNSSLKPAFEPIVFARKPLSEKTLAGNVLKHGVGALNIDGCRMDTGSELWKRESETVQASSSRMFKAGVRSMVQHSRGRYPSNIVFVHHPDCELVGAKRVKGNGHFLEIVTSKREIFKELGGYSNPEGERYLDVEEVGEWRCVAGCLCGYIWSTQELVPCPECGCRKTTWVCPVKILDEQSGELKSGRMDRSKIVAENKIYGKRPDKITGVFGLSVGTASRFFYCAKASRAERNAGLSPGEINDHVTVKPVELMAYLCRLVTPIGGTVLDPFCGSGTTGIAARLEGFHFVGIEKEESYVEIARSRVENYIQYRKGRNGRPIYSEKSREMKVPRGQLDFDL
jgi:site-specific DNA-methyltransferase (adenine-specific)